MLTSLFATLSQLTPVQPSSNVQHWSGFSPPARSPVHSLSPPDSDKARSIFLTLHVLFPHELLPALDLLDRGLVTRLSVGGEKAGSTSSAVVELPSGGGPAGEHDGLLEEGRHVLNPSDSQAEEWEVYYVQSASSQQPHSRRTATTAKPSFHHASHKPSPSSMYYEVRLDSWNCSCPAFSVSAFQGLRLHQGGQHSGLNPDAHLFLHPPQSNITQTPGDQHPASGWAFGGVATTGSGPRIPSCKHILAAVLAKAAPRLFAPGVAERVVSREEMVGWGGGWGEFGYG